MATPRFHRYAIYHLPTGSLGRFGAAWLGWDPVTARYRPNDETCEWTAIPRRYGFHATLKAPFELRESATVDALDAAAEALAQSLAPVHISALEPTWLGRFLALVPSAPSPELCALADQCVTTLDPFRRPTPEKDREKYEARNLSAELQSNLATWGYPYVLDAFRFHLTVTGRVPKAARPAVETALASRLPDMTQGYTLDRISLMGEDADGWFHQINAYSLAACPAGSDK
ncbi:DUF1045 domain-containing protein [Marivita sp. S2033]|uniref:DUF1045 domain-containing protein n=1 Tax=Marivita sp. S2033 TaxID=3373187 RepID=UPI0039827B46